MKPTIYLLLVAAFASGFIIRQHTMKNDNKPSGAESDRGRATGIGGIFFKVKDPGATREWYQQHLGLNTDEYGTSFQWYQGADSTKMGFTQWSPFAESTKYFQPSDNEFMINYRVVNIENLIAQLRESGIDVVSEIEEFEYGKFAHVMDPNGIKIELWEPVDEEYDKVVKGRTR